MIPEDLKEVKTQDLLLELIRRSVHNDLPGEQIAIDLDRNRNLWLSTFIWSGQFPVVSVAGVAKDLESGVYKPEDRVGGFMNMLPLRDLYQEDLDLHADELWILSSGRDNQKLLKLVKRWKPNEVDWMDNKTAGMMLGGNIIFRKEFQGGKETIGSWEENKSLLLRVWWD